MAAAGVDGLDDRAVFQAPRANAKASGLETLATVRFPHRQSGRRPVRDSHRPPPRRHVSAGQSTSGEW